MNGITSHLSSNQLQLLTGQLNWELLNLSVSSDNLLNDLNATRRGRDVIDHLCWLKLYDLWCDKALLLTLLHGNCLLLALYLNMEIR